MDVSTPRPSSGRTGTEVHPLGFEPRTNGLRVHCSAIELEVRSAKRKCRSPLEGDQEPLLNDGGRT